MVPSDEQKVLVFNILLYQLISFMVSYFCVMFKNLFLLWLFFCAMFKKSCLLQDNEDILTKFYTKIFVSPFVFIYLC